MHYASSAAKIEGAAATEGTTARTQRAKHSRAADREPLATLPRHVRRNLDRDCRERGGTHLVTLTVAPDRPNAPSTLDALMAALRALVRKLHTKHGHVDLVVAPGVGTDHEGLHAHAACPGEWADKISMAWGWGKAHVSPPAPSWSPLEAASRRAAYLHKNINEVAKAKLAPFGSKRYVVSRRKRSPKPAGPPPASPQTTPAEPRKVRLIGRSARDLASLASAVFHGSPQRGPSREFSSRDRPDWRWNPFRRLRFDDTPALKGPSGGPETPWQRLKRLLAGPYRKTCRLISTDAVAPEVGAVAPARTAQGQRFTTASVLGDGPKGPRPVRIASVLGQSGPTRPTPTGAVGAAATLAGRFAGGPKRLN